MERSSIWRYIIIAIVVLSIFLIIISLNYFIPDYLREAGGQDFIVNGDFEQPVDFSDSPSEPIKQGGVKELCSGPTVLVGWQVFKLGKGQADCSDPTKTDYQDAVAWSHVPNDFDGSIEPQNGNKFLDLTGVATRSPIVFVPALYKRKSAD
jgi:hypothetical protein